MDVGEHGKTDVKLAFFNQKKVHYARPKLPGSELGCESSVVDKKRSVTTPPKPFFLNQVL